MRAQLSSARRLVLTAAIAAALGFACGEPADLVTEASTSSGSGLAGGPPGEGGAAGAGGSGGEAGAGGGDGGGAPAVIVGVDANPAGLGEAPATFAQRFEATAIAHAAGARLSVLGRGWDELDEATLAEDALLARAGCEPGLPCRPIAFSLRVVEGPADRRPAALTELPWDAAAARAALDEAVDLALGALGDELAVLALGARVDGWFEAHPDDAAPLGALLQGAAARALERGPPGLLVGVGLSHEAALAPSGPGAALRALGNALTVSLEPGAVADPVPAPATVAPALDALATLAAGRPVALLGAAYPTHASLSAGEDAQATFFDALFGAVEGRRATFPFVAVTRMHDLGDDACAAEAEGDGRDDPRALAYRCSTGLRAEDGDPKAAWARFLAGAARLQSSGTAPQP